MAIPQDRELAAERGVRTLTTLVVDTVDSVAMKEALGQNRADELNHAVALLLRKAVNRSGGHTVKGTGDGILAVFPSASAALRAACTAFQEMESFNASSGHPVALRAGLAVGDIAVADSDISGLAVDQASRLEQCATPNGALLSDEVYLLARKRVNVTLVQGAELALKGIEHTVQTWSIDWRNSPPDDALEMAFPDQLDTELKSRFPFANRHDEVKALAEPGFRPGPILTILRGPSGVGKTRLVAEWAFAEYRSGAFVFYVAGEQAGPTSIGAITSNLRQFSTSRAHERLSSDSAEYRRAFEAFESAWASANPGDDSVEGVAAAVVGFLAALGADSPTIVIIDNMHRASAGTLALLRALAVASPRNVRLAAAMATDLGPGDAHLSENELRALFGSSERVEVVEVRPLDLKAVIDWLELQPTKTLAKAARVPLDEDGLRIARAFYEASGGNPNVLGLVMRASYASEPLIAMDEEGHWRARGDLDSVLNAQAVEQVVRGRLGPLSAEELDVLNIAAVAGMEIRADLVRRVSKCDRDDVNRVLVGLRDWQFIVSESAGALRFESETTRRAVYRIIEVNTRSDLHEAIALQLQLIAEENRTLVPDGEIADHFAEVAAITRRRADDAAHHYLRAAENLPSADLGEAVKLAHKALAVLDAFRLLNDRPYRERADKILAVSKEALRVADSPAGAVPTAELPAGSSPTAALG